MSDCSFCGNKPILKCALSSDSNTDNFITNVPLCGQVFGLPLPRKYPPFFRKKLNEREIREGIDKHELWLYVPPWQVPRLGIKHHRIGCYPFIHDNIPMKKIICMAKRNKTLEGRIGRLKFVFTYFSKCKLKRTSEKTRTLPKHPDIINKMTKKKSNAV